jgi:hypothetical protein
MFQDDDHITALHEIYHCGFAASQGLAIMEVNVPEAISFINFPLPASGLQRQWASDAPGCLKAMVATIGTITAPYVVAPRVFPAACGDDLALLERYRLAWSLVKPVRPTWQDLTHRATVEVQRWSRAPGASMALSTLAYWVGREGNVGAAEWQWLWCQPWCAALHQQRPAPPVAAPVRLVPAEPAMKKKTGTDIQFEWYLQDLERMSRSLAYAKDQRPNSLYRPFKPYFARPAA